MSSKLKIVVCHGTHIFYEKNAIVLVEIKRSNKSSLNYYKFLDKKYDSRFSVETVFY